MKKDSQIIRYKNLESFQPGIYLHYKGHLYEAMHLVHDANDDTRIAVHYIGLQLQKAHEGPRHAVRSWQDWNAYVHRDGSVCTEVANGDICPETNEPVVPRFRYLGPAFEVSMLEADPRVQ